MMMSATNVPADAAMPIFPISSAMCPSFTCSGVSSSSVASRDLISPQMLFTPTATTIMRPEPAVIWQPASRNGSAVLFFLMSSGSPVSDDSFDSSPSPRT